MKNFIIAVTLLLSLITVKVWNPYPLQVLELKFIDFILNSKEKQEVTEIVVVEISDKTLDKLGQWPLPRQELARFVELLRYWQAGAIVFPVLFSEPDRSGGDKEFADKLASGGTVIAQVPSNKADKPDAVRRGFSAVGQDPLPWAYMWPGAVSPLPILANKASGVGVIASTPEVDGVVRRMPMVVNIDGKLYPSLPLEIIRVLTNDPSFQIKTGESGIEAVRIPQFNTITTDAYGRVWIDSSTVFKHIDFLDVKQEDVQDKLVIVGVSASGVASVLATPNGEKFSHEVQAQTLYTIFSGSSPIRYSFANMIEIASLLVIGLIIILTVPKLPVRLTVPVFVALIGGISYAPFYIFGIRNELWDSSFIVISSTLIYGLIISNSLVREYLQKLQIKKQFGTYLSPDMVEKLQKNPDLLKLGGESRELSIMFTDVRGFTAISEHYGKDVQGLTKIMNRYMTAMTQSILEEKGTLDKYIGDAQMAFWNAPLDDPDHAKHAVTAAVKMLDKLDEFNKEVAQEGVPPFGMGLGINTGTVVVGNMGSSQRFDYTCLGDSVNLASRLEGQSKNYGVQIILGPDTAEQVRKHYRVIELDCIAVKGKKEGVKIFTIINSVDWANSHLVIHKRFLENYYKGNWSAARKDIADLKLCFNKKLEHYYEMMLERIESNPPKDFDGVYRATSK